MALIAYSVYTSFVDSKLAEEWLRWLREGHIAEVIAGGATDAEIVEFERTAGSAARSFEVRYHFPSRRVFEQYEREHAPRLRAEGLKLFPVEKGVSYRRSVGAVLTRIGPESAPRGG